MKPLKVGRVRPRYAIEKKIYKVVDKLVGNAKKRWQIPIELRRLTNPNWPSEADFKRVAGMLMAMHNCKIKYTCTRCGHLGLSSYTYTSTYGGPIGYDIVFTFMFNKKVTATEFRDIAQSALELFNAFGNVPNDLNLQLRWEE